MNVDNNSDSVAAPTVQEQTTMGTAAKHDFSATTPAPEEGTVNTPFSLKNRTHATNDDSDTAESAPPTPPPASSPESSANSSEPTVAAPAVTVTATAEEVETGEETKAAEYASSSPHRQPEKVVGEDAAEWVIVREETAAITADGDVVNGTTASSSVEQFSTRGEHVDEEQAAAAAAAMVTGADQIVPGEFHLCTQPTLSWQLCR